MEERPHHCPRNVNRRSFMRSGLQTLTALQSGFGILLTELTQPATECVPPSTPPRTMPELLQTLHASLGYDLSIRYGRAGNADGDPTSTLAIGTMSQEAAQRLGNTFGNMIEEPADTLDGVSRTLSASAEYLGNYRLSQAQQACVPDEHRDCNDHANRACELLHARGIPMYLISIWPQQPQERLRHPWHQLASCRIGAQTFLLIEQGNQVTVWEGHLEHAIQLYDQTVPMSIIPGYGISRYVPPKYDTAASKFLLQGSYAIASADSMVSLNIPPLRHGRVSPVA